MQNTPVHLLVLLLLACAFTQLPEKFKPRLPQHFTWWQKLTGLIALLLAMVILLNPEMLALGLLGDSAFFDLLVLGLSLQLQVYGARILRFLAKALFGRFRWLLTPRLSYWRMVYALIALGTALAHFPKAARRLFPGSECLV